MNKDRLIKEILELKSGRFKKLDNFKDIADFLHYNINDVKDVCLYHSGGGIWIYYILMDNKIYSISDEILDEKNSNCIIYSYKDGFNSIDDFFDFEEENYDKIYRTDGWNDLKQEFINIENYNNADDDADTDDLKDKCFCDYCDDFVPTSECETLEVEDVNETYFEVACSECYNNLYKENKNEK